MKAASIRTTARLSLLYFFIYCPLGALCPLISQYLSSIGFSGTQVGIITSLGTATAFFAGIFWGDVYSNSKHKRMILAGMCLAAAILALAGSGITGFLLYTFVYCFMYFFQSPLHGLCDSLVLGKAGSFPVIRASGAVGYAVCVFITGRLCDASGLHTLFYVYAAAFAVSMVLLFREEEPETTIKREEKIRISALLKQKEFIRLTISAFFVMGTSLAHNTYFGFLFRDGGGDVRGIGLAFMLMCGSEAVFMILIPGMTKKFPAEKLILFAMILSACRFGFYASGPTSGMLLATFFLQGIANGILLVELIKYVNFLVEPKYSSAAISVFYAVASNLSVIICNFIGGLILDAAGARMVYAFYSLYNVAAVILYIAFGLHKDKKYHKK